MSAPKLPNSIRLSSSHLKSATYNQEQSTLQVEFHNGGIYEYPNVTPGEYSALINAGSHGQHFATRFRNRKFKRIS
jgi:hypothetical protein